MSTLRRIFLGIDQYVPEFNAMRRKHGRGGDLPGVLGIKIDSDIELRGAHSALAEASADFNRWVDLKLYGTPPNIARRVKNLATVQPFSPQYITVAGDIGEEGIKAAVAARGNAKIVVVPMLSTLTPNQCQQLYGRPLEQQFLSRAYTAIVAARAQAITCPAWLLPALRQWEYSGLVPYVIATGIRSTGLPAGNHYEPRPPEWAVEQGAHAVVIESEVLAADNPLATLTNIVERIAAVDKKAA